MSRRSGGTGGKPGVHAPHGVGGPWRIPFVVAGDADFFHGSWNLRCSKTPFPRLQAFAVRRGQVPCRGCGRSPPLRPPPRQPSPTCKAPPARAHEIRFQEKAARCIGGHGDRKCRFSAHCRLRSEAFFRIVPSPCHLSDKASSRFAKASSPLRSRATRKAMRNPSPRAWRPQWGRSWRHRP